MLGWEPGPVCLPRPSASHVARISWFLQDELQPKNHALLLAIAELGGARENSLFVLSQRQITWSSQIRANKGKFVMATSEEVQRFVWVGMQWA